MAPRKSRAPRKNPRRNPRRNTRRPVSRRKSNNYKKRNVSKMSSARAPMVECKKRTLGISGGFLSPTTVFHLMPMASFLNQQQGLDEDQMIGTTIFSKYYSVKLKLNFPTEFPIEDNFRAQVVWGWRTAPFAFPSAAATTGTVTRGTVSRADLTNELMRSVQDGFNQSADLMNFRDKEKSIYKVSGKKWITPDRRFQIGQKQQQVFNSTSGKMENVGSLPPWNTQITFKPMRKVKYTFSSGSHGGTAVPHFYPNEAWIPWVGIYTPNVSSYYQPDGGGATPDGGKITYSFNDCHWYTDS